MPCTRLIVELLENLVMLPNLTAGIFMQQQECSEPAISSAYSAGPKGTVDLDLKDSTRCTYVNIDGVYHVNR
jgi:hypothetical protein